MTSVLERLRAGLAGRYVVERVLGRGGMATVYLAQDRAHRRPVAIKVLEPEVARAIGPERFLREVEVTAALNHPHVLMLIDSGEADGLLYYVMPYIEGESLRDRLDREQQLPIADALQITQEVADGLGYAHGQGVVHRDIKPENILLANGHAIVADFGIAKAVTEAGGERLTETGIAVGTPAYMSPEQGMGSGKLDARSDLYSLGCVLYEMLAGEPPFAGPTAGAIVAKKLSEPTPRISVVRESVPPPIEAALGKVLSKAPADRYPSAQQFTQALAVDVDAYVRRRRRTTWLRRAAVAAGLLPILAGGTWGAMRAWSASSWRRWEVDPNTVAVVPFRIAAASPDAGALEEGLPLLLYTELTGEVGPRSVNFGTLLRRLQEWEATGAWREEEAPLKLAASFGAGLLLEGAVVELGAQLMVNAILRAVPSGEEVAQVSEPATMETLNTVPGRLLVGLLGSLAGEDADRLRRLADHDPEAVKQYMLGLEAEGAGNMVQALRHFERAEALDSTFAHPVLQIAHITFMGVPVNPDDPVEVAWGRHETALRRAQRLRAGLGPRDDAALTVMLINWAIDSNGTAPEMLEASRAWSTLAPDDPDAVLTYAGVLSGTGALMNEPDWKQRFRSARERAWSLDSTTPNRILRAAYWDAFWGGDREWARRVAPVVAQRVDSSARDWAGVRWALAHLTGDSATVSEMRSRAARGDEKVLSQFTLGMLGQMAMRGDVPMHDVALLAEHVPVEPIGKAYTWLLVGRVREAAAVLPAYDAVLFAPVFRGLDSAAALAADTLRAWLARAPREPIGRWTGGFVRYRPGEHRCYALLLRAQEGDTAGVRAPAEQLEAEYAAALRAPLCPVMVQAIVESHDTLRADTPALDRFEAVMRTGPGTEMESITGMITVARLARRRGQLERALNVLSDGDGCCYRIAQAPLLKEQGELALILGDTARAVDAWSRYLNIRIDPDSGAVRAEVDSVRAMLERLRGGRR